MRRKSAREKGGKTGRAGVVWDKTDEIGYVPGKAKDLRRSEDANALWMGEGNQLAQNTHEKYTTNEQAPYAAIPRPETYQPRKGRQAGGST